MESAGQLAEARADTEKILITINLHASLSKENRLCDLPMVLYGIDMADVCFPQELYLIYLIQFIPFSARLVLGNVLTTKYGQCYDGRKYHGS